MRAHPPSQSLAAPDLRALLDQCVRCGLCLPACPTYTLLGTEMDSPRGRIALIRAAAEGRVSMDGAFEKHIGLCLSCRACEPACPSGVKYGMLVERARSAMGRQNRPGLGERLVRRLALKELMPYTMRLRTLARGMTVYQRVGLARLFRRLPIWSPELRALQDLLPPLSMRRSDYRRAAKAQGQERGVVALFHGCIQDAFLAETNAATIRVLQRNGYRVEFPPAQTCCGAAQVHVGEEDWAREMARRNVQAFSSDHYAAIINNAGGCGATLKEYGRLLQDDPSLAEAARMFSKKTRDISEFLSEHLEVLPTRCLDLRVTYLDSCHLRNVQRVAREPRDLIKKIPGVTLVELAHPDRCCGSAGVYNIVQPEIANALLESKMTDIAATGAEAVIVSNTGCHLQMLYGIKRAGSRIRVLHLIELLDRAYAD